MEGFQYCGRTSWSMEAWQTSQRVLHTHRCWLLEHSCSFPQPSLPSPLSPWGNMLTWSPDLERGEQASHHWSNDSAQVCSDTVTSGAHRRCSLNFCCMNSVKYLSSNQLHQKNGDCPLRRSLHVAGNGTESAENAPQGATQHQSADHFITALNLVYKDRYTWTRRCKYFRIICNTKRLEAI